MEYLLNSVWNWELVWRKKLFSWEEADVLDLNIILEQNKLKENAGDGVGRKWCNNFIFSVKNLSNKLLCIKVIMPFQRE